MTIEDLTARAVELDSADPLAPCASEFLPTRDGLTYLDGNSLGRPLAASREAVLEVLDSQWAGDLIESWNTWIGLSRSIGDRLAVTCLGASEGTTVVSDSTSVNIYKLASAALDARPDRPDIVADANEFPTDLYVLDGLARARGGRLRLIPSDPVSGIDPATVESLLDDRVALVSLSHANYRSGALVDMTAVTAAAHRVGALAMWDLCHSVGVVPIELEAAGVDLAVGCTYKYLNGGPGSPAFLFVAEHHHSSMLQPIHGWFGQSRQFDMDPTYDPVPAVERFLVGTPPILSITPIGPAVDQLARAGISEIRAKSRSLTELIVDTHDLLLAPLGFTLGSPRRSEARGGHVTVRHPDALAISTAIREEASVVGDFRRPDGIRLAPAPLYTSHCSVVEAMAAIATVVSSGAHERFRGEAGRVT